MNDVIQINNVTYQYPGTSQTALSDINGKIRKGSFTVVMGETGAGKSTFLMTLNGVIPKMMEGSLDGDILFEGQSIIPYRVQTVTQYVGLVMQDAETQILGRTVAEDVMFGPRNYLVPRTEILERVKEALATVRLNGFDQRDTTSLSGGEKQRLVLAGILALKPEVLLLDEPTSELDPLGREQIYSTINLLRKTTDLTILAVEHSSEDIIEKADHLLVFQHGALKWSGAPHNFFRNLPLVKDYGIKPIPVAALGWQLKEAGLLPEQDIPLTLEDAASLLEPLLAGKQLAAPPPAPVNNAESIIEIQNLSFGYHPGQEAISDLSLEIKRGDFVAIIGQNGAGKTTFAKQLNGLLKPNSGKIILCGKDVGGKKPEEMASTIGYVFQNPDHQIFSTTVANEIMFGLKNSRLSAEERKERLEEVLRFTGLEDYRDRHPFSMGKGERQKLAVASILALKPDILVVDEPTTGQDWNGIHTMMEMMKQLNQAGTTVLMITHDMDVVCQYANQVILLSQGKLLAQGAVQDVMSQTDKLHEAFVTTTQTIQLCQRLAQPIYLNESDLAAAIIDSMKRGNHGNE